MIDAAIDGEDVDLLACFDGLFAFLLARLLAWPRTPAARPPPDFALTAGSGSILATRERLVSLVCYLSLVILLFFDWLID